MSKKHIILVVIAVVILLASAVNSSLVAKKFQKNFREEMAQRLDLEEKVSNLEKTHQNLQADLKASQDALAKAKAEADDLNGQLAKIREEKAALSSASQKPTDPKAAPAP